MVSTCGTTADHSRRMLKKLSQQSRSRRTDRRGTLRTCSRRERSWGAFSASCSCSCSCSPGARPAPMRVEAIRKGLVSEMWNGITWSVSTRLGSRTRSSSTTRALPSLSLQALKVLPTTPVPSTDSQQLTPCAIPVWLPRDTGWNSQLSTLLSYEDNKDPRNVRRLDTSRSPSIQHAHP